jgi:hypothetical protein
MGALGNLLCHSGMARKMKEKKLQDAMGAADQKTVKRVAGMQRAKKILQRVCSSSSLSVRLRIPSILGFLPFEATRSILASSYGASPALQIRDGISALTSPKHRFEAPEDMEERMKEKEAEKKRSRKEKTKRESVLSPSSSTSSLASSSSSSSPSSSELENEEEEEEEEEEDGGNGDHKKGTDGEGDEDREAKLKNGFASTKIQGNVQEEEEGQQQQQQEAEEVSICKHLKKKYKKKKKKRGIDSPTQCDFCAAIYADHHEFF